MRLYRRDRKKENSSTAQVGAKVSGKYQACYTLTFIAQRSKRRFCSEACGFLQTMAAEGRSMTPVVVMLLEK